MLNQNSFYVYLILLGFIFLVVGIMIWYKYLYKLNIIYNNIVNSDLITRITNNPNYKAALNGINTPWMNPKWSIFHNYRFVTIKQIFGGFILFKHYK